MVFKDPGSRIVLQGGVAQPRDFGRFLFDKYWLAVEIVSILLLVALVAILHLGKRRDTEETEKGPVFHLSPSDGEEKGEGVSYHKEEHR